LAAQRQLLTLSGQLLPLLGDVLALVRDALTFPSHPDKLVRLASRPIVTSVRIDFSGWASVSSAQRPDLVRLIPSVTRIAPIPTHPVFASNAVCVCRGPDAVIDLTCPFRFRVSARRWLARAEPRASTITPESPHSWSRLTGALPTPSVPATTCWPTSLLAGWRSARWPW